MKNQHTYIKLWDNYLDYFHSLSDAALGRLVLAMLRYRQDGSLPQLRGREGILWPALKREIDEDVRRAKRISRVARENGRKGGRPRKSSPSAKTDQSPQKPAASEAKPEKARI